MKNVTLRRKVTEANEIFKKQHWFPPSLCTRKQQRPTVKADNSGIGIRRTKRRIVLDEEEHRVVIARKWKKKTSRNGEEEEEPKIRKLR